MDPSDLSQVDFTHGGPYLKFVDEFNGYPAGSWVEYYTKNSNTGELEFFSDCSLEAWLDYEYRWFKTIDDLKKLTYEQLHELTIYVWEYGEVPDPDLMPGD